ncbi:uncharacterized protein PHACADRAFT_246744 [Phanerochaete carnosa HHB-10118-sp]|uniref:Movement protein n=1 Tax=Phanerochaete carnosa (strain HHB-10118-sp) TaxID=650164 RepID=K5XCF8_PHACS|nr:uncharacterized protein PHACADRAFT_246744 [Phanerochaete carnosa HHB-10118-sp]EKM60677.1 hypothetical protein PHACADRAFT_246744 [Phanerochaete carnosa HHB-10118-sp]
MSPAISPYPTTHFQVAESEPLPTRPLDVLFYVGVGVVAVILVWFSIYIAMKIYALLGGPRCWLGRYMHWKARPNSLSISTGEEDASQLRTSELSGSYSPYLNSSDAGSEGLISPGGKFQGLGIDFGDASPIAELDQQYGGPVNAPEPLAR